MSRVVRSSVTTTPDASAEPVFSAVSVYATLLFGGVLLMAVRFADLLTRTFGRTTVVVAVAMAVGASVDVMVAAAVATITLVTVAQHWMPIAVLGIVGGVVTTVTVLWTTSRLFDSHQFGRALMMYGNMTGTLSTGLALTRVVDPQFETPVANDYMFASGITFALSLPMILLINLPIYWHTTGNPVYLWMTLAGFLLYAAFSLIAYAALAGKKRWARFGKVWYEG